MKIRFKTGSQIKSPYVNDKHGLYSFYVNVKDLPTNIPTEVNPRHVNTHTQVYKSIVKGLLNDKQTFYLDNKGMFITAKHVSIAGHVLDLDLGSGSIQSKHLYGLVDGGHTYYAIIHNASLIPSSKNVYVHVEIITGVSNIVRLAKDLNTNVQVQGKAIANLAGKFNPIKKQIATTRLAGKVSYTQNDNRNRKPYDVLRLLSLFYILKYHGSKQPASTYSSRIIPFKDYLQHISFYSHMFRSINKVCSLYDYIECKARSAYMSEHPRSHFGRYKGVLNNNQLMFTHFGYYKTHYNLYRFLILPIFSGLRVILKLNSRGDIKWLADPYQIINEALPEAISYLISKDKNALAPRDIGWDNDSYRFCYDHFRLAYAKHIINRDNR